MQVDGGELYDGQADLTGTPETATDQPDQQLLVARSETSASPIENVLVDEAQRTTSTGVPRMRIYWLPILNQDMMRCCFETKKEEIPLRERQRFFDPGLSLGTRR